MNKTRIFIAGGLFVFFGMMITSAAMGASSPESVANAEESAPEAPLSPLPLSDDEYDDRPIMDREGYDPNYPVYENIQPRFAFGFRAAVNKFPVKTAIGSTFQVIGEYLFPQQGMGIFSVGGHIGVLPIVVPGTAVPISNSNGIIGMQGRYQLKIAKQQWVVPTLTWEWEFVWITRLAGDTGKATTNTNGFGYGLWFLLNPLDPSTARDAYQSLGTVRSYLTAEVQSLKISTNDFTINGNLWFFGVRMEFR